MAPEPSSSEPSPDALYDKYSINCWSGPRCCSTSLMYSFAQRSDTAVLDEPLYASYLRLSGVDRPYLDLVLAAQENDGNKVVDSQILGPRATKVLYAKHISKHKLGVRPAIWRRARHVILVREPLGVLTSFARVLQPSHQELGYTALLEVLGELRLAQPGRQPIVVLSDELVRCPEPMLRSLCGALDLPFEASMLSWPAGPKPYDGCWAPWWYANTHASTGFDASVRQASQPASGLQPELPAALRPLLGECWAIFNLLRQHTIKPMDGSVPRPMPPPATGSGGEAPAADDAADGRDTDGSGAAKGGRSGSGGGVSAAGASPSSCSSAPPPSSPLPSAGEPCTAPLAPPSSSSADADGQRRQLSDQGTAGAVGAQRSLTTPSSSSSSSSVVVDKHADSGGGGGVVGRHHGHGDGHHDRGGTHSFQADPRNADVLVGIRNGVHGSFELVWRPVAAVSVLDSGFMLGDGVWEGIRLHRGTLMFIDEHLDRLWEGAKAIDMDLGLSQEELLGLLYRTIDANGMTGASGVHIRLMVSRGLKPTPYQSPYITIGKPTVVIVPEYKEASQAPKEHGIRLFTVHVRRGPPDVQDPGWNSLSKLNCIAACIQAHKAGADEALMLDPQGFVATCNSTNFFIVKRGEVVAPSGRHQMRGITRANVLRLCAANGIPCREADFYLTQVYSADEVFVTGTFAGLIPVVEVDGRVIASGRRGPLTARLQQLYVTLMNDHAAEHARQQ